MHEFCSFNFPLHKNFLHLACPHKFSHGLSLKVIIILKAVETPVSNLLVHYICVVSKIHGTALLINLAASLARGEAINKSRKRYNCKGE